MEQPKAVGDKSTLAIMFALRLEGYAVLVPFGENTRYDLVVDDDKRPRKVQCKTGCLSNGCVVFRTASTYAHDPNPKVRTRNYQGEIDEFAVYCPQLGSVYLIPIEDVMTGYRASLRIDPSRNGQHKNIRLASTYEIARIDVY
jgi:hypothetical protein